MRAYNVNRPLKTIITGIKSYEAETLEAKIRRRINNKEPTDDGRISELIYTERKDGVIPGYDVRTDRLEYAAMAADKKTKHWLARREERIGELAKKNMAEEAKNENTQESGKPASTDGTDNAKA